MITALDDAEQVFLDALPNIRHVRDGLTHFEDWARGRGGGPQADARKTADPRDVARDFWSFGYDPAADTVTLGPFTISVSAAVPSADVCVPRSTPRHAQSTSGGRPNYETKSSRR